MAEQLCELRKKKGGGSPELEETVLWENPDTTKTFAAQDITLIDSINNYDYIVAYFTQTKDIDLHWFRTFMPVSDYKLTGSGAFSEYPNSHVSYFGFVAMNNYLRTCYYVDNTTMHISAGSRTNGTQSNNACIPVKICGAKLKNN